MNKIHERSIVFVCAPTSGGKSRLGYVLGEQDEALYSYSSISPSNFFDEKGIIQEKYNKDPSLIIEHFYKLNSFLRGDSHLKNKNWFGSDKLFHYDFNLFDKKIKNYINKKKSIELDDFYQNYDLIFQESRKNGNKSLYTIYEIEGAENTHYLNLLKRRLKKVVVFSILRNPFDIIASNKVIALVRGSTKKEFKGGFLRKGKFNFLIYINQIQDQYFWLMHQRKNNLKNVTILDFKDLKSMNRNTSHLIANKIFNEHNIDKKNLENIAEKIKKSSLKKVFQNEYIYIDHVSTKYYSADWQSHLPIRLTKKNRPDYMNRWELSYFRIYQPFYEYLLDKNYKINFTKTLWTIFFHFPYLFLSAFFFGFKEIRTNLNWVDYLKLRYNAVRFIFYSFKWCVMQHIRYWI